VDSEIISYFTKEDNNNPELFSDIVSKV